MKQLQIEKEIINKTVKYTAIKVYGSSDYLFIVFFDDTYAVYSSEGDWQGGTIEFCNKPIKFYEN